jgi:potassium efflux system protein
MRQNLLKVFLPQHGKVFCHLILAFILCASSATLAWAQEFPAEVPAVTVLKNRMESINNEIRLTEAQKAKNTKLLQLAISRNEQAAEYQRQTLEYTEILNDASRRLAAFAREIASPESLKLPQDIATASLAELEALVARDEAELAALRSRVAQVDSEVIKEKAFDIEAALAEARRQMQTVNPEPVDADASEDVVRMLAASTHYLQQARVENLEQRLLSRKVRLSLWDAEQKLLAKQVSAFEARITRVNALLAQHHQNDANQIAARARETLASLSGEPQLMRELAQDNSNLADELATLVLSHETLTQNKERVSREAQNLQQKYANLTAQLELTQLGSSPEFGAALRRQRDQLMGVNGARHTLREQEQAITDSRIAQFRIDALREPNARLESSNVLAQLRLDAGVTMTPARERKVKEMLETRENILDKLSATYWNHIDGLTSLASQNRYLIAQSRKFAELIDQQLLWMPSSRIMGVDTVQALGVSLAGLAKPAVWHDLGKIIGENTWHHAFALLLVSVMLFILLWQRPRLMALLAGMKGRVGKVNRDKISLTIGALVTTFLLALPGSLVLTTAAFLVDHPAAFSASLARALMYGAMVYLILEFVLQSTRRDGLLELHFNWSHTAVLALQSNLPWFIAIIVPAIVLNSVVETTGSVLVRDSLGRFAFIAETLAMTAFAYRVLAPERGILRPAAVSGSDIRAWLNRQIRFLLVILIPLILVAASVWGYHYTAVQLEAYLLNSALVILLASLLYCLSQRALAINERRLTLEKIRAQRAAAAKQGKDDESADAGDEGAPTALDLQEIDLQSISKQTRALLELVTTVAVALALWNVWSGIFPAFKPLVNVELWHVLEQVDGAHISTAITLWDLGLAIATIVVTFLAARNISGLLEVALLSRLPLRTGTSYAITTIARYVIVLTGTIITLQWLGAQWSKLQWLVAAVSVGLGFGLQEIVANFVSGIVILFERPIRIGDTVSVGDQMGTVSRIHMRATTIVDFDRREIIIPNKAFVQERLVNWTLTDPISRRKIHVGVVYGSDIALVEKLLLDIAKANPKVLDEPPPEAFFLNFGESSLDFSLRIYVRSYHEFASVLHELHKAIDREFRAHGVEIAFPQRELHFDSQPVKVQLMPPGEPEVKS